MAAIVEWCHQRQLQVLLSVVPVLLLLPHQVLGCSFGLSPVLYLDYSCQSSTPAIWKDESTGNRIQCGQSGDTSLTSDGYSFPGRTDAYFDCGDNVVDGLSEFTVAAWARPTSLFSNTNPTGHNANENVIIHKAGQGDDNLGLTLNNGKMTCYIDTNSNDDVTGSTSIPLNEFGHFACVYTGSELQIFHNGAMLDRSYASGDVIDNTNSLRVGAGHTFNYAFSGDIASITIFDQALTVQEVDDLMDLTDPAGSNRCLWACG